MKIIVQNLAIEYEDVGNGPVLLMLHGWQNNLHTFDLIKEKLKENFRIISLDLPGFGASDLPKETWDLSHYADFVDEFIKKLNLSVYAVVGHSFGGRVVIKSFSESKLEVEKVVLIAAAGIYESSSFKNKILKIISKILKPILFIPPFVFWKDRIRSIFYSKIKSDYHNAGVLQKTFVATISEDLENTASKIDKPTLLIYAEKDDSAPVSYGERFYKKIQNSELRVIKGGGHFIHQEKSDEVAELMYNFLS